MRLPDFLQFTPDERRAALAILLFTGGGGLLLEIGRRHPAWTPDLLTAGRSHHSSAPGGTPAGMLPAGMPGGTRSSGTSSGTPADSGRVAASIIAGASDPLWAGGVDYSAGRSDAGVTAHVATRSVPDVGPEPFRPDQAGNESEHPIVQAPASGHRHGAGTARKTGPAAPIDVNTADTALLETLPGIGPAMAGRIIAERGVNGPFRSIDDLTRVKGIGKATAARLKPFVKFAPR